VSTAADGAPPSGRRGRRAGGEDTRAAILACARAEFADKGYDKASMRGIARAAAVDPALVHHYFGDKEHLFVEAMHLPFDPETVLPQLLGPGIDGLGERLVRLFLRVWDEPASREPFFGMLRSAMSSERAADMLRGFVSSALLGRVAASIDLPDRQLRVSLAASQLVGMALLRYVVQVAPLTNATEDQLVLLVAPTIQRYLTA
jgi:AcrR family transcriptional regulator